MSKLPHSSQSDFDPMILETLQRPPSPVSRIFIYLIVVFISSAILLSYVITVDIVASGIARSVYVGRIKKVQSPENLVIDAIYVKDGEDVAKGEVLATFNSTAQDAEIKSLYFQIQSREANILRLNKVLEFLDADCQSCEDFINLEIPSYYSEEIIFEQKILYSSQINNFKNEIISINKEISNLFSERDHLKKTEELTREILNDLDIKIKKLKILKEKNIIPNSELEITIRDISDNKRNISEILLSLNRNKKDIENRERSIINLKTSLRRQNTEELVSIRESLRLLKDRLTVAQRRKRHTQLKAPISGTVENMNINTEQQVVIAGHDLMSLVPYDSAIVFEVKVPNHEFGFISLGQAANIKLDAFPFERHGTLKGMVTSIARNSTQSEENPDQWYYSIKVTPEEQFFLLAGEEISIKSGMTATVDILTGERSILSFFVEPIVRQATISFTTR